MENLTVADLTEWLRDQDPATKYNFVDTQNCLLCQFFRAKGRKVFSMGASSYDNGEERLEFDTELTDISVGSGSANKDYEWTFGAALARAESLL